MARWIVLAGVTALLVIGYFATQSQADGWGRRNVRAISATLQQRAETAIEKIGAQSWASVFVDGQTAILSGEAPTDSDRQDTIDAVRAAEWDGGKWIGGITVVRNATTVAKPLSPYEWIATMGERGSVRLSGVVPGQRHRRAILAEAQRLFAGKVVDEMKIAQGAPTGAWTDTAIFGLAELARLNSGEVHFKNKQLLIRGSAPDTAVQKDVQDAAEVKVPRPYKGVTDLRTGVFDATEAVTDSAPAVTPPPAAATPTLTPAPAPAPTPALAAPPAAVQPPPAAPTTSPAPHPATATLATPPAPAPAPVPKPPAAATPLTPPAPAPQPATATPLTTPEGAQPTAAQDNGVDCQKLVDRLMANNTIAFASGTAEIRSVAHEMLNNLAKAASQCPLKIRITGHTDTTATDTADPELSQQRADAVANYLIRRGVARKRVNAIGAGTDQPVGDNDTVQGQAKNRRIEITVTN